MSTFDDDKTHNNMIKYLCITLLKSNLLNDKKCKLRHDKYTPRLDKSISNTDICISHNDTSIAHCIMIKAHHIIKETHYITIKAHHIIILERVYIGFACCLNHLITQ